MTIMLSPLATTRIYTGLGAAAGLGLAWGGCAYAALWPDRRFLGEVAAAPRRPGELALTFDDGPNPAWTPQLLDLLAKHDVRATFFMVGKFAQAEPELVRRACCRWAPDRESLMEPSKPGAYRCARVRENWSGPKRRWSRLRARPVKYFPAAFWRAAAVCAAHGAEAGNDSGDCGTR
jgi:peptidoglycan/xylan/chitin deacetylase (PgdA/CDA1 family)